MDRTRIWVLAILPATALVYVRHYPVVRFSGTSGSASLSFLEAAANTLIACVGAAVGLAVVRAVGHFAGWWQDD